MRRVRLVETEQSKIEIASNQRERIDEFIDFGKKDTKGQFKHSKAHKGQLIYFDKKNNPQVLPIYANQNLKEVLEYAKQQNLQLYLDGKMFYSQCLVNVPNDFYAGKNTVKAGIYKIRTIITSGQVKLESATGDEILTSIKNLVNANFYILDTKELRKLSVINNPV